MAASNVGEAEFIGIIRRYTGKRTPIGLSSAVYHDLGVNGDVAEALLMEISERYSTSFETFDFRTYFRGEYGAALWLPASLLGLKDGGRLPLTVEHLLAVVRRGEWFPPSDLHAGAGTARRVGQVIPVAIFAAAMLVALVIGWLSYG